MGKPEPNMGPGEWHSASKGILKIKDMAQHHILNAIKKIKREGWREDKLLELENELRLRRKPDVTKGQRWIRKRS
jgi:hypothetical protein